MDRRAWPLLCLLFAPAAAWAGPYAKLAEKITRRAERAGVARIAVMPFQAVSGRTRNSGMILSERLVSHLASAEQIQVVERTLLDRILKEQGLGSSGMLRQEDARQVGRILGVDAIVTGTFLRLSHDRLEIHARLIATDSARILGAVSTQIKKEWQEAWLPDSDVWRLGGARPESADSRAFGGVAAAGGVLSGDTASFEVPLVRLIPDPFRDAPRDIAACVDWEDRADKLQEAVVELKARYWAAKLREPGFSVRGLTRNPGSEIRSLTLRHKFYARLKRLHNAGYRDALGADEERRLRTADGLVAQMADACYR